MFAATTRDALSTADHVLLKKAPSSIPSCLDLIEPPIASSWAPDNSCLFIATETGIQRYETASNILRDLYAYDGPGTIQCMVAKDGQSVIFAAENGVHILECSGNSSKITESFASQGSPVTSLSLSTDGTLLALASIGRVDVYTLSSGSKTTLRGLGSAKIDNVVFLPSFRSRLLVSSDRQLFVYDTARPSAPSKTIQLSDVATADIVAVACSPFSKTLIAVATAEGSVTLLDLDKDKPIVRTVYMKVGLTTLDFTPEGGAMYLGTSTGKVLIVDLRLLDKTPKSIMISHLGNPIQTISVQRKTRTNDIATKTASTKTSTNPKSVADLPAARRITSSMSTQNLKATSKETPSPGHTRAAKAPLTGTPIQRRAPSSLRQTSVVSSPIANKTAAIMKPKSALSPSKDPLGNSGSAANVSGERSPLKRKPTVSTPIKTSRTMSKATAPTRPSPAGKPSTLSSKSRVPSTKAPDTKEPRRTRTLPSKASSSVAPLPRKSTGSSSAVEYLAVPDPNVTTTPQRPRAGSSASQAETGRPPSTQSHTSRPPTATSSRPSSSASRPPSSISRSSTVESIHTTGVVNAHTRTESSGSARTASSGSSRSLSPSPEVPVPVPSVLLTPVAKSKHHSSKKAGMSVLGLGTPEVDRWIQAGQQDEQGRGRVGSRKESKSKSKGKTVGFKDEEDEELEAMAERARTLSLQISPRRPLPTSGSGSSADSWASLAAQSPELSALAQSQGGSGSGGAGGGGAPPAQSSAHDLLKTIVQDVMFDFQRETKSEMMGLHLDLLRMGRSWKAELRTLMDEYVGDLGDLREENERLRRENERLRRGWA